MVTGMLSLLLTILILTTLSAINNLVERDTPVSVEDAKHFLLFLGMSILLIAIIL